MVVMATDPATDRISQILDVRKLAAGGGVGEVRRKLAELGRRCRIAVLLGSLGGGLQVCRNLLRDLLILGGVGLLKLLERRQQLSEG